MKRIVYAIFLLAAVPSLARSWEDVRQSGTLKLATEGGFPPFNFFENGKLTGFEIELAEALATKLGVKVEWKTQSFESLLIGLNQDRYDVVVASHAITPEREKAVDFLKPHYCSGGVILRKGPAAKGTADLQGKVVATQVGSIYPAFLEKLPGLKGVRGFPKDTDAVQAVVSGRVDAAVTDELLALQSIQANPKAALSASPVIRPERNAMAVAKGNATLKAKLDETVGALVNDGTYERLTKKYFPRDLRCP